MTVVETQGPADLVSRDPAMKSPRNHYRYTRGPSPPPRGAAREERKRASAEGEVEGRGARGAQRSLLRQDSRSLVREVRREPELGIDEIQAAEAGQTSLAQIRNTQGR